MTNHLRFFTGVIFFLIILELITVDKSIEDSNFMNLNGNFNILKGGPLEKSPKIAKNHQK